MSNCFKDAQEILEKLDRERKDKFNKILFGAMDRSEIRTEAYRRCGNGIKGMSFELGAEYVLENLLQINKVADECLEIALRRGKTHPTMSHLDTVYSIFSELKEFREAKESIESGHLPQYTESQEELIDILICCLTELRRRDTNIEELLRAKIEFNRTRE